MFPHGQLAAATRWSRARLRRRSLMVTRGNTPPRGRDDAPVSMTSRSSRDRTAVFSSFSWTAHATSSTNGEPVSAATTVPRPACAPKTRRIFPRPQSGLRRDHRDRSSTRAIGKHARPDNRPQRRAFEPTSVTNPCRTAGARSTIAGSTTSFARSLPRWTPDGRTSPIPPEGRVRPVVLLP